MTVLLCDCPAGANIHSMLVEYIIKAKERLAYNMQSLYSAHRRFIYPLQDVTLHKTAVGCSFYKPIFQ